MRRFGLEIAGPVVRLEGGYGELRFAWDDEARALVERMRGPTPDADAAQRLGARLADALDGPAWTRFADALAAGDFELTVRVTDPGLFRLPWELLRLPGPGVRLGQLPGAVVRHAVVGRTKAPPSPSPLPEGGRVLFAHAAPRHAVPARQHARALADTLAGAPPVFAREATVLADASRRSLAAALADPDRPPVRALHLLAHGAHDPANPGATALVLCRPDAPDEPAFVRGEELAGVLAPHAGRLRLVVVAACGGADPGSLDVTLGSVAEALHLAGIEAVVGARYPLGAEASVTFARAFYGALLGEWRAVEDAFVAARQRLFTDHEGFDWAGLQLFADGPPCRPVAVRPYRGLLAYEAQHRRLFFGRDAERTALRTRLRAARDGAAERLQVVVGASGSGKSSLVRAGVLPDLGQDWTLELLRPAQRTPPGPPPASGWRVLFVDQFEEVFALDGGAHAASDPREEGPATAGGEAQAFVDTLAALAADAASRTVVLLAMRADAIGRCGALRAFGVGLDRLVNDDARRLWLYGLEPPQRIEVVEGPARLVGLTLEPGLAQALAAELGEEPGALPLVAHALDQVWTHRAGDTLTHAALAEVGGVRGAIARTADEVVRSLSPAGRRHARRLLVSLVDFGEAGGRDTRRRVWLDEVGTLDPTVLRALTDARLVVTGEADGRPYVDLAHEALIRSWKTLGDWLREDAGRAASIRELSRRADRWARIGPDGLLTGLELIAAEALHRTHGDELPDKVRRLVDKSRKRRFWRRFAGWTTATILLVVVGGAWGYFSFLRHRNAQLDARSRDAALFREALVQGGLASESRDPAMAAAHLREVHDVERTDGWRRAALELLRQPLPLASFGHIAVFGEGSANGIRVDPEGRWILILRANGPARLYRFDGRGDGLQFDDGPVADARFGGGGRLALAHADAVVVWRVFEADGAPAAEQVARLPGAAVSVDLDAAGERVATVAADGAAAVRRVADPADAQALRPEGVAARAVRFAADGALWVLIGNGRMARWRPDSAERLQFVQAHPDDVVSGSPVAVFPGNGQVAPFAAGNLCALADGLWTCAREGFVTSLDPAGVRLARTYSQVVAPVAGRTTQVVHHLEVMAALASSADGRRLATLSSDGRARTWDAATRAEPRTFAPKANAWVDAALDATHGRLATIADDGWLCVHAIERPEATPACAQTANGHARTVDWSIDGERLAMVTGDGAVAFARADATGVENRVREGAAARAARFLPAFPACALVGWSDGRATAECLPGGTSPGVPTFGGAPVTLVAVDPNGEFAATAHEDRGVRIWNVARPADARRVELDFDVAAIAFDAFGALDIVDERGEGRRWSPARPAKFEVHPDGSSSGSAARPEAVEPRRGERHAGRLLGFANVPGSETLHVTDVGTFLTLLDGPPLTLGRDILHARLDGPGEQVVTIHRDGAARVWQIGASGLRRRLLEATTVCLDTLQWQVAGFDFDEATARVAECERRYGRTPGAAR